ncbi:MAG: hypothetical protein JOZ73_14780 [Solirubrobacterales bacterium]|nr:hypothetical protein [Solirubrobacterales bacterium]
MSAASRVDALFAAGLRLARSARSGRVLLARVNQALDPTWIPRPWGDELVAALEEAHASSQEQLPMAVVERVLREAWGVKATEELEELEAEPVAVTPSAQVHRGVLDGTAVAVKVLRPGLATSVRQDLVLLEGLLAPLNAAFPAADAGALLQEVRERALDELDLEVEAAAQRQFHRRLRGHDFLVVPQPVTRLATDSVLVSEWVDGVSLWDAPDPDRSAAQLVVFVLGAGLSGYAYADPKPEDMLVRSDGRLAVLDFGPTRVVSPDRFRIAAKALAAFAAEDPASLGEALEELGWLERERGTMVLELGREILGELAEAGPARLDGDAVLAVRDRLLSRLADVLELMLAGKVLPEDLWPLRGAGQVFATVARVGATGAWRELALGAMRDGWDAKVGD